MPAPLTSRCGPLLALALALLVGCGEATARPAAAHQSAKTADRALSRHVRPRALAMDVRGDLLYVALSTGDGLAVMDVSGGAAHQVATLPMCAFPHALAALPEGGVVVACRFAPELRVVTRAGAGSTEPRFQVRSVDAGPEHGHGGIAVHPQGRFAYVASPPLGGVKIVALGGAGVPAASPRFVATGLIPRQLRLVDGGAGAGTSAAPWLLVSNFIGHTVTVHRVAAGGDLSAAVQTITTEAPVLDFDVVPALPRGAIGGPANEFRGALLLATHEDRAVSRANISVEGLDSVLLLLPPAAAGSEIPFIDAGPGRRRTVNLTERAQGQLVGLDALVINPAAGLLAVTGAGTDNLVVAKYGESSLLTAPAWTVGAHPSAVTFLPDGRAVTADRLSDTLTFLSPAPGGDWSAARTRTVPVGPGHRRTPGERGELLFFSRALVPNNVAAGPLSVYTCAACHADGQIDGRRHPAKRNKFYSMTKTCRGLIGTEPFLSLGKPDTFSAFADNIVSTHAQGALNAPRTFDRYPVQLRVRAPHSPDWSQVTLSPRQVRAALAAFMAYIPVEPSPFVPPHRRALTPAEQRGLMTFRDHCARCHHLTRSTTGTGEISRGEIEASLLAGELVLTSPRSFDVGTPVLGDGGNNPPSLRGVWAAAPYFSDGSAATLEGVLNRTNPHAPKIHAAENANRGAAFSADTRADLLAFLRAL